MNVNVKFCVKDYWYKSFYVENLLMTTFLSRDTRKHGLVCVCAYVCDVKWDINGFRWPFFYTCNTEVRDMIICLQRHFFLCVYTYSFVVSIRTVWFAITPPFRRDAIIFGTRELFNRLTCGWWTWLFVTIVSAIVISIANPAFLDASAIGTRELIWSTCIICEVGGREKKSI